MDKVWKQVFQYSNRVLRHSSLCDVGVGLRPDVHNSDFHPIALRLQMLSSGIKYLTRMGSEQGLDDDAMRRVLSAHKQLSGMRRLLEALQTNDDIGFILAIEELEKLRPDS